MSIYLPTLFNFAALVVILFFALRKPAKNFLIGRSENIAKSINEAEHLATDASAELSKWENNIKASEAYSVKSMEEAKAQIQRLRETTLARARTEATRIQKEGELVGQSERTRAKAILESEIVEKSLYFAKQYLATHVREEDRHKLVSEFVETVGNGKA